MNCHALRDLIPFVQFKKCENIHGGALILVKLIVKLRKASQLIFVKRMFD